MVVDVYVRVSRVQGREGESFISPAEQRRACEAFLEHSGHTLGLVHEDLDVSGRRRSRPGLDAAMARVEGGEAEAIVVAYLSRFGRSVPHLASLVERLEAAGAALFTVREGIDSRGPTGRLLLTIIGALAAYEVEQVAEGWLAARGNAVDRGVYVGGTVPPGYLKGDDGRLVPDPERRSLPQEFFERRVAGESWGKLADWLADETGETWSVGRVRYLVGSRTYLGEVHGGQGLVNPTAHQPLVDRATWEAANVSRGIAPARSGRASGLLSGIIRCASCRYAMKPSMNTASSGPFLEYRCKAGRRQNASPCLKPAAISAHLIEPLVVEAFFGGLGGYRAKRLHDVDAIAEAEAQVLAAEAELDAALDTKLAAVLGPDSDRYLRVIEERQGIVDVARRELARARSAVVQMPDVDFRELWPDLPLQEQRSALASVLDCVFVRRGTDARERSLVLWRGEAPELPVRGRRWTPVAFEFPVAVPGAPAE